MTSMPEMVSLFNGMGGACAALISISEFDDLVFSKVPGVDAYILPGGIVGHIIIVALGLIIGSVSFAGSIIAWGKLNGRIKDYTFKGQHIFNIILLFIIFGFTLVLILTLPQFDFLFYIIFFLLFSTAFSLFFLLVARICLW